MLDGGHKAPRHVAYDLQHPLRLAALDQEVVPEALRLLAFALGDEDPGALLPVQVDKDGHVAMPALAGRLIQAERLKPLMSRRCMASAT